MFSRLAQTKKSNKNDRTAQKERRDRFKQKENKYNVNVPPGNRHVDDSPEEFRDQVVTEQDPCRNEG